MIDFNDAEIPSILVQPETSIRVERQYGIRSEPEASLQTWWSEHSGAPDQFSSWEPSAVSGVFTPMWDTTLVTTGRQFSMAMFKEAARAIFESSRDPYYG